jgi:hypothetical protein
MVVSFMVAIPFSVGLIIVRLRPDRRAELIGQWHAEHRGADLVGGDRGALGSGSRRSKAGEGAEQSVH